VQSGVDNCVYVKHIEGGMIVIAVWVDDLIIGANNDSLLCDSKNMMKERFKMKDLGKLSHFLGINFEQDDGFVVKVNQTKYLCKVLGRFGMSHCKPRSTPSFVPTPCSHNIQQNQPKPRRRGMLDYSQ